MRSALLDARRTRSWTWWSLAMIGLIAAGVAPAHAQNLVVNGGFEQGNYLGTPFLLLMPGSTRLTGWTIGPDPLRWYETVGWVPAENDKSIELNDLGPSGLEQIIPTTPGRTYELRFSLAGDPYGGDTLIRYLRVLVGAQTFNFTFDTLGRLNTSMGWREERVEFIAASAATRLRFESLSSGSRGPVIDAVSIVEITPGCVADVDDGTGTGTPDGGVTVDDLLYYLFLFEFGDARADVDDGTATGTPDGGVTIDDLLYFLFRFEVGC